MGHEAVNAHLYIQMSQSHAAGKVTPEPLGVTLCTNTITPLDVSIVIYRSLSC